MSEFTNMENVDLASILPLIVSLVVLDVFSGPYFFEDMAAYRKETLLKNMMGTMCNLYQKNDRKLYHRTNLMLAVDNLEG